MANEVRYGLAGSVWTSNLRRGHRVAHSIDAGILWVNCWLHRCVAMRGGTTAPPSLTACPLGSQRSSHTIRGHEGQRHWA